MENRFVVAIGSSDGGIEAMKSFFDNVQHDHATYIILRHMPFGQQSQLDKILQRHSNLKIIEVSDDIGLKKDTVYIAPGSMYMTIKDDHLFLKKRMEEKLYPNRSIDVFLESLANEKGSRSIVVILSGNGSDGVNGAALVKAAGGMVIVQDPHTCKRNSMPLHVIKKGIEDYILITADMPGVILEHINSHK